VDPTANKDTKTFAVFVRLANDDLRLKPGLTAFVRLERTHPGVLTVPSVALIYPTGLQESSLFVVESSRARLRKVAVGVMAEGRTTIVQGLQEGERVVTVGQLNLRDGDRVRLGDDDFKHLDTKRVGRPGSGAERGNAR
jgi:Cu(I)/Ag(I) efflux system membrane fusion protein